MKTRVKESRNLAPGNSRTMERNPPLNSMKQLREQPDQMRAERGLWEKETKKEKEVSQEGCLAGVAKGKLH